MSLADLQALASVRRHREGQAERALCQARAALHECTARAAAAHAHWEQASERQVAQRTALCAEHRGRALGAAELRAWATQERRLMGELAEQAQGVRTLEAARQHQAQQVQAAQQRLTACRRAMEKLGVLTDLLGRAADDE
ncbi:hypothetical protein IAE35_21280 [Pseudomonas sp. S75]|uniref:hypothetical protein n=1 Tax=unclassified Pseudomonas TaxID=196821 RepID=UPI0019044CFF|nr:MULTISPECIES: hypothetical protein [unclassified Pseudomonas]MBJ9977915.1 hypothetical protein [Pseudomonas sp. S30]MBK0155879.1 hypothetical protein [Pseudomonas sp. S75]